MTEDEFAAREHALHADLVIAVCHVPPTGGGQSPDDPAGQITPRLSWSPFVTDVQVIQLLRSARAALDELGAGNE